jgi:allantoin racemase
MSRRLLVINPNTSASVSARLGQHVQAAVVADDVVADVCTARFGAEYIDGEAGYAVAGHGGSACPRSWSGCCPERLRSHPP